MKLTQMQQLQQQLHLCQSHFDFVLFLFQFCFIFVLILLQYFFHPLNPLGSQLANCFRYLSFPCEFSKRMQELKAPICYVFNPLMILTNSLPKPCGHCIPVVERR